MLEESESPFFFGADSRETLGDSVEGQRGNYSPVVSSEVRQTSEIITFTLPPSVDTPFTGTRGLIAINTSGPVVDVSGRNKQFAYMDETNRHVRQPVVDRFGHHFFRIRASE